LNKSPQQNADSVALPQQLHHPGSPKKPQEAQTYKLHVAEKRHHGVYDASNDRYEVKRIPSISKIILNIIR